MPSNAITTDVVLVDLIAMKPDDSKNVPHETRKAASLPRAS